MSGGALLVATPAFLWADSASIPLWYHVGSFGIGALALVAGVLLWRGLSPGRWLSVLVQAIQVLQISKATFLVKIIVGVQLTIFFLEAGGIKISPGFAGSLGIWGAGHTEPNGVGCNLFALSAMAGLLINAVGWRSKD
jgi:hypothetical protein